MRSRPRCGPTGRSPRARRPHTGRALPGHPATPRVLRGQCCSARSSGTRRSRVSTTSRQRASSRARVSSASASRKPPPLHRPGLEFGEHPHRFAVAGRRDRDAQHIAQRMRLVGGHDQHATGPGSASQTAVAHARVDLPTPPLPTKRLIRAGVGTGSPDSLSLDSFLQILQCAVNQPAFGLTFEHSDHRDGKVDRRARR